MWIWIRIIFVAWIRIRNFNADPDPGPGGTGNCYAEADAPKVKKCHLLLYLNHELCNNSFRLNSKANFFILLFFKGTVSRDFTGVKIGIIP